ncbi:rhombotin-1 isoform X3 [Gallus gallus]|uniref:rhombotin-1 isoform X3 n=1 Tax=Gallus gallus TaxID=9031 RepID=UPI001F005A54|nr:rhombotin-1 isoform X3 [Gallus gallus]
MVLDKEDGKWAGPGRGDGGGRERAVRGLTRGPGRPPPAGYRRGFAGLGASRPRWARGWRPRSVPARPGSGCAPGAGLQLGKSVPMLSVQPKGKQKGCAGCNRKIKDRYLLKALDKYWHEDCLKCACCDCRLGEVGSTLYTKANLILCRRDYLRLFGTTGNCAACSKLIPAFEMVMRARDNVYHLDCFACQLCNQRFCVGDKFFLKNNMILCQMDYEEGQLNGSFESQVQ